MKVGVIGDVHGNRIALDAVIEEMGDVDEIVCVGDVVGYYPWPGECIDRLRDLDIHAVRGNHDSAVIDRSSFRFNDMARAGVSYAIDVLEDEHFDWLESLPVTQVEFDGSMKLVHGHPADPDRYTYPDSFSPKLLDSEEILALGHTHVQHVERYPDGIVLNPGSVGQPRDGDPRAGFAIVDLDELSVEPRRVEYDIDAVDRKVKAVGLPRRLGRRLRDGQ